jgi:putative hemolysin
MTQVEVLVLVLAVALLFVAAFLAMAETSLSRIEPFRAHGLAEEGRRGSAALVHLVESPERFAGYLNGVLLLLLATQVTASTAIAYLLLQLVSGPVFFGAVVAEILVGYVLAEAMPKTFAVQHSERAALLVAPLMRGITRIVPMRGITRGLIWVTNVLVPGKGLKQGPFVYEQQILALADSAVAEKAIEGEERALIHSVIEFGTTVAREVMVPRTDMVSVGRDWKAHEAMEIVIARGFSRLPVYGADTNDIVGMLFAKDLMRAVRDNESGALVSDLMRDAKFIPETKRVAELLREMQREKTHMAIVVDEYGSVVGIVTLEDLVEEVVGEITDEYDAEELPQIEHIADDQWIVDARMSIDEVSDKLGVVLPDGDWDTVGGMLIDVFERVPSRNEVRWWTTTRWS